MFDLCNSLLATITAPVIVFVRSLVICFSVATTCMRLDVPLFRGELDLFDPVFNSFWAMILAHHQFSQPVVRVFCRTLLRAAATASERTQRAKLRKRRVARWWLYALMMRNRFMINSRRF